MAILLCACSDEKKELIDPYLRIDLESEVFNAPIEGKNGEIKIYTNLPDWKLMPKNADGYDWCQMTVGLSASDTHLLYIAVSPNNGTGSREAEFTITGTGVESIPLRVVQLGTEPEILVNVESMLLSKEAQTFSIKVTANLEYTVKNVKEWLVLEAPSEKTRGMVEKEYQYSVTENTTLAMRRDTIRICSVKMGDEVVELKVPVNQESAELSEVIPDDAKVKVESVEMEQGTIYGKEIPDLTIDGDLGTFYSAGKQAKKEPVIFQYTLAKGITKVDYITLRQRNGATSGNQLTKGKVEYKSNTVTKWTECGSFDETQIVPSIRIDVKVMNPTHFRLTLERTPEIGSLSFAEFECYQKAEDMNFDLEADAKYFEDNIFSQLKQTTTKEDIEKITHPMLRAVAQELLDNIYSKEFRVRTYNSCKDPKIAGRELTIGARSICDNPTGLFFEKGKTYMVFVGDEIGEHSLNLFIRDWRDGGDRQNFGLKKGLNTLRVTTDGVGYIQYWTDTDEPEIPVKIHVCNGNELGFWDVRAGHTNEDWKRILGIANDCMQRLNISNAMIDVLGEQVQMVNKVECFNSFCTEDIAGVMKAHDRLLMIEYTLMGLVKHNAVPRNRILGIRAWGGNPNWNGTCANFPNTEKAMLDKETFISSIWLFAHEFGHANQVAQMSGAGWSEVTNNLYAQQALYLMDNGNCRLEYWGYKRQGSNERIFGDLFNAYLNDALIKGKYYLTHEGGLNDDPEKGIFYDANPFVTLAPLWQFSLFFLFTDGAPWAKQDFWADVIWAAIHDNTNKYTYGEKYVNFMKRSMDASGLNLTKFFKQIGLLKEMDIRVGDYGGPKRVTITKDMVNDVEEYGKSKSPAPTPVINYISANSLEAYKKQLPVEGKFNEGVSDGDKGWKIVMHSVWKNVAAFETYAGDKMVEVCISGTGVADNSRTFVRYPESSTCIKAVSWDGKRTLVYGKE